MRDLQLDLEVFSGPFDLLLTLVLREEVDLLEVELADIVLAYLDHLEAKGELDLEVATEFLVLIAALLELKSRLMLPREEEDLLDLEAGVAAEELLARMLEARRYRSAAAHLRELLEGEEGVRYRSAPLPKWARRTSLDDLESVYRPARLGAALGALRRGGGARAGAGRRAPRGAGRAARVAPRAGGAVRGGGGGASGRGARGGGPGGGCWGGGGAGRGGWERGGG